MTTGDILDTEYELLELLGDGGMGQVFRARHLQTGEVLAIKTMLPQFASDPGALRDLEREVRISRALRHPNIVEVYEYRVFQRIPYLLMEFVPGRPLNFLLADAAGNRLEEGLFLHFAQQVLAAVEYAHQQGVVHRDLKPGNVMVRPDRVLKLLDFGIAATMKATFTRLTGHGSTLTIPYASPEQINGEDPAPSMDIYSLGCVFYEMLTGRPPFYQGEILHQQLTKQPKPLEGVAPYLNDAILYCLQKDPAKRPSSIGELRALLAGNRTVRITRPGEAPKPESPRQEAPKPAPPREAASRPQTAPPPPPRPAPGGASGDNRIVWLSVIGLAIAVLVIMGASTLWNSSSTVQFAPEKPRPQVSYPVTRPEPRPQPPPPAASPAPPAAAAAEVEAALRRADAVAAEGNYETAAGAYREALRLDPANERARRGLQAVIRSREAESFVLAEQLIIAGDYEGAIAEYRKVLSVDPNHARARSAIQAAQASMEAEQRLRR